MRFKELYIESDIKALPWRRRLESKIREAQKVTCLPESVMRDWFWMNKRYKNVSITEAVETAKTKGSQLKNWTKSLN